MGKVLVETSARHIHVTQADLEILCGKGYQLEVRAPLSQPGQYVSTTRLDIVGPKNTLARVSILGPVRKATQVEVSATDARTLGISAPIRESGDVTGSAPVRLVGPAGSIDLTEGAIVAKRHIHMTPADAEAFAVKNGDVVGVRVKTAERSLIFEDVVIRVRSDFSLAMHIDTDESNAAGISGETFGEVIKL
ncbi:MAG: phosphate propanoyltransferase [Bacilli bacterium]|jgi:putative phosphotransacetylase|nr:phosphate propanoyltransferase [Bacilli bacterium]MCH4201940.1 phosphate propanoyltransferase [Bacilli bacterium]MCH4235885.1 phosphate propanoyltransferase [Bacilli bacterium]